VFARLFCVLDDERLERRGDRLQLKPKLLGE
jgi:hypothetical protein